MDELVRKTNDISESELSEIEGGVYEGPTFPYVVQPGDCLSVIAVRFHVDMWKLAQINGIEDPDKIKAYQVLRIPYYYY